MSDENNKNQQNIEQKKENKNWWQNFFIKTKYNISIFVQKIAPYKLHAIFLLVFIFSICTVNAKATIKENIFQKITANDRKPANTRALKLKDGRIFFKGFNYSVIYNPVSNSFSQTSPLNKFYDFRYDDGFVLDDGRVLFIGPYYETPERKFATKFRNLVWNDLKEQERKKYRKRTNMTDEQYDDAIEMRLYKYWNYTLSKEEQKAIWFPKFKENSQIQKEYNNYVKEYETSMRAQLYDPKTNKFTYTGKAKVRRTSSLKAQLKNGKVFIIGGTPISGEGFNERLSKIELFDPKTEIFELINTDMIFGYISNITLMNDNRLHIDFCENNTNDRMGRCDCYIYYDIKSNSFSKVKNYNLEIGKRLTLRNGNILLFTKTSHLSKGHFTTNNYSTVYLFNPYTEEIKYIGKLIKSRGEGTFGVIELKDGHIFIFGGGLEKSEKSAEILDLTTGKFEFVGNMKFEHNWDKGLLLDNGNVFLYGNGNELYIPKYK